MRVGIKMHFMSKADNEPSWNSLLILWVMTRTFLPSLIYVLQDICASKLNNIANSVYTFT